MKTLQKVWKYCYSLLLGIDTLWKMLSVPNFYKILPRWSINILHNKIPVCNSMKLESSHTGSCNIDCFQTNFHHQIFLKVKKTVKKKIKSEQIKCLPNAKESNGTINQPWWPIGLIRLVSNSSRDRRLGPRFKSHPEHGHNGPTCNNNYDDTNVLDIIPWCYLFSLCRPEETPWK